MKWKNRFWFFELTPRRRIGFEMSRVEHAGVPYLDRFILYIGGPTLRLHKFWRGDDDRAPHDHPWGFWTMPFSDYWEWQYDEHGVWCWNAVKAWRFHWRPATYRHIVFGRCLTRVNNNPIGSSRQPFWTFVVTKTYERSWGFWPRGDEFVPWREWPASDEQVDLLKQRPTK